MKKWFFLFVLMARFLVASEYALAFVHIGDTVPSYLYTTLKQARFMNRECPIYFFVNDKAFQLLLNTQADFITSQQLSLINVSSLPLTKEHEEYREVAKFTLSFREGFWNHATERFFYLYDYLVFSRIENLIQIETDVMLYADVSELMPGLQALNVKVGAPFQWKTCCIPSFVFFKDAQAAQALVSHIVAELTSATSKPEENFNDMMTLASFQIKWGESYMTTLPIVMPDYAQFYPPSRVPYDHGGTTLEFLSKNAPFFPGYLFDAAALGIYVKGYDRRNGPNYTGGVVHPKSLFDPRKFHFTWGSDAQGRIVPYLRFKGKKYRIINLHFHSKLPEDYTSYGPRRAALPQ